MNDEFWKAIIKGMTPEASKHVHLWWQIPLFVAIVFSLLVAL